ncbi:MAG TPA: hypothetical protein VEL47_06745 [Myxococcota bacterium]|nr:hypothetical protein [Myxococcota bacterium]
MAIGSFSMMAANSYPELPNISASCPTLPYLGKPGKKPRGLKRVRMTTSLPNQAPLSPLGKFNQWMQEKIREANGTPKETVTNEILNGMALNNDIIWYGDIVDKNVLQQSVVTSALPHDCRSEILQYLTKLTPPNRHRPSSSELSNLLDFNGWAEDQLSKVNKSTEQLVVDDILNEMALQNNVIWDGDEAHRNNLKQLILNSDLSVERKNEIIDYLAQLTPNRQLHLFYQRRSKNTARNQ